MNITTFGFECQSNLSTDRLATFNNVLNIVHCASNCNRQPLCHYFNYDTWTKICRIFSDGSIAASNSSTSRVGTVRYIPSLYSSYGQPCASNNCQVNRYLSCNTFNICQCPASQVWYTQMCVADKISHRWNSTGITIAGITGRAGATPTQLNSPTAVTLDSFNAIYISARDSHRVQKWLPGAVNGTTVAGQSNGSSGSGLAYLNKPTGLAVDSNGSIYIADYNNHRIVRWSNGSTIGTIIAGNGTCGSAMNLLCYPRAVTLDPNTNTLFISDSTNYRIMQYLPGATFGTVVAGGNGQGISSTQLMDPRGLHFDSLTNSIVISNGVGQNIVRWVLGSSSWTLMAGVTNVSGGSSIKLLNPADVVLDSTGNMYVADLGNNRIQFFLAGQLNGTTIAGVVSTPGNTSILFNGPAGLALDNELNLYVADLLNDRVQKFLRY
ncbi:unnamed protein product [Adineta steineri]|uniref:Apple domain-containing protein n=1 Tax=Adineta steineri TaxID=433720 RepID=A0A815ZXE5_9BILA|nr:unnamed protein product [Adineta steineri]CAF1590305.1 unnamed protein product [Adineta steineri]